MISQEDLKRLLVEIVGDGDLMELAQKKIDWLEEIGISPETMVSFTNSLVEAFIMTLKVADAVEEEEGPEAGANLAAGLLSASFASAFGVGWEAHKQYGKPGVTL